MIAIAAAIAVVVIGTLAYLYFSRGGKIETTSDSKTQAAYYQTDSNPIGYIHLASVARIPGFRNLHSTN
jgi:cell division protein FtsN